MCEVNHMFVLATYALRDTFSSACVAYYLNGGLDKKPQY